MYAPSCFLTSEHCPSVNNVTRYGEDDAVDAGVCFGLNGSIVRYVDHGLKVETRSLTKVRPLKPSRSISPGFTSRNTMIVLDNGQNPGLCKSGNHLRSGVRKLCCIMWRHKCAIMVAAALNVFQSEHPFQRCRLGEITGLRLGRVCDYLITHLFHCNNRLIGLSIRAT